VNALAGSPGTGEPDEHLASTARIHHRRAGGLLDQGKEPGRARGAARGGRGLGEVGLGGPVMTKDESEAFYQMLEALMSARRYILAQQYYPPELYAACDGRPPYCIRNRLDPFRLAHECRSKSTQQRNDMILHADGVFHATLPREYRDGSPTFSWQPPKASITGVTWFAGLTKPTRGWKAYSGRSVGRRARVCHRQGCRIPTPIPTLIEAAQAL
jgi:hypothetical protein